MRVWAEGDLYVGYVKKRAKKDGPLYGYGAYGDKEFETRYGPYNTAGKAQAAITSETNPDYNGGWEFLETRVEKLVVTFETYDYAKNKKERAAQLRREKKEREIAKIELAKSKFFEELGF